MIRLDLDKILNGKDEFFTEIPPNPIPIIQKDKSICPSGKNVYDSIGDVIKAIKLLKKKQHKSYNWYKCNECGYYHLTTLKKNKRL